MWDKKVKKWIQRPVSVKKTNNLSVVLSVCKESHNELNIKNKTLPKNVKLLPVSTTGIADTGCSVMCAGDYMRAKLNVPRQSLLTSNVILRTADGKRLTVLGVIPVV